MTDYKRIILAQFGVTEPLGFFSPYRGLVWWRKVSLTQDDIDASFWTVNFGASFDDPLVIDEQVIINTVSWSGRQLSEIDNLDDLFREDIINSFFMDIDAQILYIKNFDFLPVWQTPNLVSGVVSGVATMADVDANGRPFNAAFGGFEYEIRLIDSSITDQFKLDNWSNNIMQFENFSFSLLNPDGRYDTVRDDVMNQTAKLFMAEVEADKAVDINDFNVIATGAISDVSFPDADTATVTVSDIRSNWEDTFPKDIYPETFLGETVRAGLIGKNFPIVFGACRMVPAYLLQEGSNLYHLSWASAEYPIQSVGDLVWDNNGIIELVSKGNVDLINGTIELESGSTADGQNVIYARSMSGIVAQSISLTDPTPNTAIDTAVFLALIWAGKPFVSSYFNISHIREVRDRRPYQVGLAFPVGGAPLTKAIEACTFSVNTVFYTNGQVLDIAEMTVDTSSPEAVYTDDLINSPPIVWDKNDYMSRIATGYNVNYQNNSFVVIADSQFEESAISRYILSQQYNFETVLTQEADATAMGLERYEWSVLIRPRITLQFGGPMEIEFLDVVSFDYLQYGRQRLQDALYRVTAISRTRNTAELTFIENQAIAIGHRIGRMK